jgi:hypothetical protein
MYARVLIAGTILLALAAPALAQIEAELGAAALGQAPRPAAPAAPAAADLQSVAQAIEEFKTSLNTRLDQLEERFVAKADLEDYVTRADFEALQKQFKDLQSSFDDQAAQLNQFRLQSDNQISALDDQAQQIRSIVNSISRSDGQQRPILDVRSSMASEEFKTDLSNAVRDALPRQGLLRVTNQMETAQYLRVNGQLHTIPPQATNDFPVAAGTLTTELLGEAPKNWTIAAPNFEQGIIIAPRQMPNVVGSPVVYWSY